MNTSKFLTIVSVSSLLVGSELLGAAGSPTAEEDVYFDILHWTDPVQVEVLTPEGSVQWYRRQAGILVKSVSNPLVEVSETLEHVYAPDRSIEWFAYPAHRYVLLSGKLWGMEVGPGSPGITFRSQDATTERGRFVVDIPKLRYGRTAQHHFDLRHVFQSDLLLPQGTSVRPPDYLVLEQCRFEDQTLRVFMRSSVGRKLEVQFSPDFDLVQAFVDGEPHFFVSEGRVPGPGQRPLGAWSIPGPVEIEAEGRRLNGLAVRRQFPGEQDWVLAVASPEGHVAFGPAWARWYLSGDRLHGAYMSFGRTGLLHLYEGLPEKLPVERLHRAFKEELHRVNDVADLDAYRVKTLDVRTWFPEEMKNSPPLEILLEAFHVRPDGFQVLIEVAPPLRNWELLLSESLEVLEAKVRPVE